MNQNDQFDLKLPAQMIQTILDVFDQTPMPQRVSRPITDSLVSQLNAQIKSREEEAAKKQEADKKPETPPVPPAPPETPADQPAAPAADQTPAAPVEAVSETNPDA